MLFELRGIREIKTVKKKADGDETSVSYVHTYRAESGEDVQIKCGYKLADKNIGIELEPAEEEEF